MQILQEQHDTPLQLTGNLDVNAAAEVHRALLTHLEHSLGISLDLSQIENCDAAGVQLLIAMQRSAEAVGKPFAVITATDAFTMVCASLGISSEHFIAVTSTLPEPACMNQESSNA